MGRVCRAKSEKAAEHGQKVQPGVEGTDGALVRYGSAKGKEWVAL